MAKVIQLTRGHNTIVDDADYEWLNQWKWHASGRDHLWYATRVYYPVMNGKKIQKKIFMHRLILGLSGPLFVDHKDRNPLNNQRSNLRICTRSQNNINRRSIVGSSSRFLGVYFCKPRNTWLAQIKSPTVGTKSLGKFNSEIEAALAYNKAAIEIHGEFANLNVI